MNDRLAHVHKYLSVTWLLLICCASFYSVLCLKSEGKIENNLLSLLPADNSASLKLAHDYMDDTALQQKMILLIGHDSPEIAKNALKEIRYHIANSELELQEHSYGEIEKQFQNIFTLLYKNRNGILSVDDKHDLETGMVSKVVERSWKAMLSPFSILGPPNIQSDPFYLFSNYVVSIKPKLNLSFDEEKNAIINSKHMTWYVMHYTIDDSPYSFNSQQKIKNNLLPFIERVTNESDVQILKTGAVFYAIKGAEQAKKEISTIGMASVVCIILLLLIVFRSARPIIFSTIVIFSGLNVGLATCLCMFGNIHIITVVFGCSLVGIAVDYAIHYYNASCAINGNKKFEVIKHLLPALPLGVLSSVIGYGLLMFTPFPGIQQMSVLTASGLAGAFLTVVLLGPYIIRQEKSNSTLLSLKLQDAISRFANTGLTKFTKFFICLIIMLILPISFICFNADDDFRNFQSLNAELVQEENKIREILSFEQSPRYIFVSASSLEEALRIEEDISTRLQELKIANVLSEYRNLSQLIPSIRNQDINKKLIEEKLYGKVLTDYLRALGLDRQSINDLDVNGAHFALDDKHLSILPQGWRELVKVGSDAVILRTIISGVSNPEELISLTNQYKGSTYVDIPLEYTEFFRYYRYMMMCIISGVIFSIILLITMTDGFIPAITVIRPVLITLIFAFNIIMLVYNALNIFHLMGLLLVLCIGLDHALFLYYQDNKKNLLIANTMATLTTILSFGLLFLSQTNAVHSFGLSVFVGMTLCFILTTLYLGNSKVRNED